jgi:hypothetical protein
LSMILVLESFVFGTTNYNLSGKAEVRNLIGELLEP